MIFFSTQDDDDSALYQAWKKKHIALIPDVLNLEALPPSFLDLYFDDHKASWQIIQSLQENNFDTSRLFQLLCLQSASTGNSDLVGCTLGHLIARFQDPQTTQAYITVLTDLLQKDENTSNRGVVFA